ncbi:MAG TPA: hypothetical protein VMG08_16145 [Allosphingosinicella sp.]|nr:hypothetical protein [Allosphingosinicella sp.]
MLQLLQIANISRDLDRSRDDTAFADRGGRIVYVFDENIFEMFVEPYEQYRQMETFYGKVWENKELSHATCRRYESQAALIASEFLVSRPLPGSGGEPIYMTDPHRWELYKRLTDLTDKLRGKVEGDAASIARSLQGKSVVLGDLERQKPRPGTREQFQSSAALRQDLDDDLGALAANEAPAAVMDRLAATRTAAEFLATDHLAEPLDQLRRLMSPAIRTRIRDLQDRNELPDSARRSIKAEKGFWLDRLNEELDQPANRFRKRSQDRDEAEGALRNDAYSIAYLKWTAKHCLERGERLVFITNDDIIFDAYRRWYASDQCDASVEPFFMRRAAQYSPIFIPRDSGGDLSQDEHLPRGRQSLFDQVQAAIETTLIPLVESTVLEQPADAQTDGLFSKTRERLALKLIDFMPVNSDAELKTFISPVAPSWLSTQAESLEEIRGLWQSAHRLAIGASYGLVSSRLTPEQRLLSEQLSKQTASQAAAFLGEYAQTVLASLVEESVQWWLPLARDFILGRGRDPDFAAPSYLRIAVALDLESQFPELSLERNPELVFAQAAVRAVAIQDAHNANRFAKLALRANQAARCDVPGAPGLTSELEYLAAVACRLLICTVSLGDRPGLSAEENARVIRRGVDQIKQLYSEASNYLRELVGTHHAGAEAPQGETGEHRVRFLRAISERASLNLFTATAFGLARPKKGGVGPETQDSLVYLDQARKDLRYCALEDAGLEDDPVLALVRTQYLPNVAAYEVLAYLLDATERSEQWPTRALSRLARYEKQYPKPHPLLRAELAAHKHLGGQSRTLGHKDFVDGLDRLHLPLDKTLYREIFARIFDVNIHKPR